MSAIMKARVGFFYIVVVVVVVAMPTHGLSTLTSKWRKPPMKQQRPGWWLVLRMKVQLFCVENPGSTLCSGHTNMNKLMKAS